MPINLGLQRIAKLLGHLNNPQNAYKSIHIAGTNGKGSTLAYISSVLTEAKIKNGKFTSPHIINYHDCISINNQTYPKSKFDRINQQVIKINNDLNLECTEFEILTATAFKIFALEEIEMALVEVGVGGRLDATNVLIPYGETIGTSKGGVVATAITKIGLDHEKLLGGTLLAIAKEKSGIIKYGIPCFVDSLNDSIVLQAIREKSREISCPLSVVEPIQANDDNQFIKYSPLKGSYQANNLSLVVEILKSLPYRISEEILINGISKTNWPGRLQTIQHKSLGSILLDGAHNESAAIELGKYLNTKYRKQEPEANMLEGNHTPIILVIGMTKGKAIGNLLKHVVSENDIVIPTLFTQPENMPWINSELISTLTSIAKDYCRDVRNIGDDAHIHQVFQYLKNNKNDKLLENKPIVVCGSLYLCGDVLREIAN